mmetsp:Transcript_88225/g.121774  ORF Transcript_88225/g.121774 Transcript_88225/m.121774 type:complete len:138 (-) Transcript_88225:123-536(-)
MGKSMVAACLLSALLGSFITVTTASEACYDFPSGWEDSEEVDCASYASENLCTSEGGYGSGWDEDTFEDVGAGGLTAPMVCCVCGGGAPVCEGTGGSSGRRRRRGSSNSEHRRRCVTAPPPTPAPMSIETTLPPDDE